MSSNTEFCIWCYIVIPCILGIIYNFIKLCNITGPTIEKPNLQEINTTKLLMLVLSIIVVFFIGLMIIMRYNI